MAYAYSLYHHGIFGKADNNNITPSPSAHVAPVIPAYISAFMHLNSSFFNSIDCFVKNGSMGKGCEHRYKSFKYANLGILAICLAISFLLLFDITKSLSLSWLTLILIVLSGAPFYYANHFLTETVYIPTAIIFYLLFASANLTSSRPRFLASGVLLGILALTRPSFYYLFFILLFLLPLYIYLSKTKINQNIKFIFINIIIFLVGFTLVTAPWLARNHKILDRASVTVGYGAFTLSSRVSYNKMTGKEYLAAWIYWLPDFGDSLAEDLFGKEHTERLNFGSRNGFINHERQLIRKEVSDKTGALLTAHETGSGMSPVSYLIKHYVLDDLWNHVKVTLVMAWRGLFIEKYFGLLGFLSMMVIFLTRNRNRQYLLLFSIPAFALVFFHAFLTASIPRYNLSLLLPMSFCLAIVLNNIVVRLTKKT